eukprot:3626931-Prymnesium_polylepis.1
MEVRAKRGFGRTHMKIYMTSLRAPRAGPRSRLTATHARSDAPCSLCPSLAPETEVLAALGAQHLQLHHFLRLLRLELAGGRRR